SSGDCDHSTLPVRASTMIAAAAVMRGASPVTAAAAMCALRTAATTPPHNPQRTLGIEDLPARASTPWKHGSISQLVPSRQGMSIPPEYRVINGVRGQGLRQRWEAGE